MKRFYINCMFRVLLLTGTICLLAFLLFKTDFVAAAIFIGLIGVYQIFALIRYATKTNRDLTRFLQSIRIRAAQIYQVTVMGQYIIHIKI